MYLSRVIFNPLEPQALRALANPYQLHQLLWRAFPDREAGGAGRVLFRLEALRGAAAPVVLVQSDLAPDWTALTALTQQAESRAYAPGLQAGEVVQFRLRANPTKRLPAGGAAGDGPRVQLFREEEQLAWLQRKGTQAGFAVLECQVSQAERQLSHKSETGPPIVHQAVTFDGVLRVTDLTAFQDALTSGIGSAKGFGFGLLSIARR